MPDPIAPLSSVTAAARAYGATSVAPAAADFGTMVGNAARASLQTLRQSEAATARGIAGTADVQEVVQAATAAELTVQTVTQLRDKVVGAYMDVLRMAV
jgi:flagellar hook-basal body complex protein FliE